MTALNALLQSFSDFAITIVEALGPDSRLIVEGASGERALYMGAAFEWITLVAVLIYLFFGVRYYNYIRYVMLSTFGVKLIERKGSHLSRGEQNNYLAIMIALGLLLTTMAASKAVAVYAPQMLIEGISATSAYAVLAIAIALFVGVILGGYVVVRTARVVRDAVAMSFAESGTCLYGGNTVVGIVPCCGAILCYGDSYGVGYSDDFRRNNIDKRYFFLL